MQGRFRALAQHTSPPLVQGVHHPLSHLSVDEAALVLGDHDRGLGEIAILGGFLVFLGDGGGLVEGRQPGVLK